MTEVITKNNNEIALDTDPTRTHVIHRIHLVEHFLRNNGLPKLLTNLVKTFNDDKTEPFYNEDATYLLSQFIQPIDSFVERKHLNDHRPIFPDTCKPSRMDTTIKSPVKDNSCHSTPNLLACAPDSGFPQSSPNIPRPFQPESAVISSQLTTLSPLPRTSCFNPDIFQSTSTGTTPRSRNAESFRKKPGEWYGHPYF